MRPASHLASSLLFFLSYSNILHHLQAQPSTQGFTCTANQSSFPCQTYAFYLASAPNFVDLASIGDLFSVSRLMISKPSNISSPTSPLVPDQPLFVPLSCSCSTMPSIELAFPLQTSRIPSKQATLSTSSQLNTSKTLRPSKTLRFIF
ncbi:hypothetical protein OIU85_005693 [Salix viminalis]|uniref:NFP/LYK4/5 first LysM domain-containing protein n=1 Tax=Salix viminalis TaxID=40686 RepID=A0A9Q0PJN2_SALVM|nr:hypothetical protein OIU85_005693 [Salix viminalis]